MYLPFPIISDEVIPHVRRKVAQVLYQYRMSQDEIASILGTSQAMVSKYLRDRRDPVGSLESIVDDISRELSVAAMSGEDSLNLTSRFSSLLLKALMDGKICRRHNEKIPMPGCTACFGLSGTSARGSVLRDLITAAAYIGRRSIPDLIPAVKVNIAQVVVSPGTVDDVASFPERISFHDGRVIHLPPEFGTSGHLSGILLAACSNTEGIRAVMNLRYDEQIGTALKEMDMISLLINRDGISIEDQISQMKVGMDLAVVDPGDFGIEPCLYIFGRTALEVVSTASGIQDMLRSR